MCLTLNHIACVGREDWALHVAMVLLPCTTTVCLGCITGGSRSGETQSNVRNPIWISSIGLEICGRRSLTHGVFQFECSPLSPQNCQSPGQCTCIHLCLLGLHCARPTGPYLRVNRPAEGSRGQHRARQRSSWQHGMTECHTEENGATPNNADEHTSTPNDTGPHIGAHDNTE